MTTYRLWALADERGRLWTLLNPKMPLLMDGTPKLDARKPEVIQTPRKYKPVRVRVTVEVE